MGDVALCLPVLNEIAKLNRNVTFVLITKKKFAPLFSNQSNIEVFAIDFESDYKGLFGLWNLTKFLITKYPIDTVVDLHLNLRTYFIKLFFRFNKIECFSLNKARFEKSNLTRRTNKKLQPLKHTTERYLDVFKKTSLNLPQSQVLSGNYFGFQINNDVAKIKVGIAPFAQHKGKIWPFENYFSLFSKLNEKYSNIEYYLFGGGKLEIQQLKSLTEEFSNAHLIAGNFTLPQELEIISGLYCMLAMDSSNLHFAAISGIKTISIWGATHPFVGFGPVGNQQHEIIQNNDLSCRPCSVYGNKECFRKDYACLHSIDVQRVFDSIIKTIEA